MPRLEGKRSNSGLYVVLMLVVLLLIVIALEYTGNLDLLPTVGRTPA